VPEITAYPALTTVQPADVVPLVDVTDTTAGAQGTTKQATIASVLGGGGGMKPNVAYATTSPLTPAPATYSNGVLTAASNAALAVIDGVTPALGDRILVKNETSPANNGIYTITSLGSGSAPWQLTRAADMAAPSQVANARVLVQYGTIAADSGWVTYGAVTAFGAGQAINWTQYILSPQTNPVATGWSITALGLALMSERPVEMNIQYGIPAGQLVLVTATAGQNQTITTLGTWLTAAGTGTTPGGDFTGMALYLESGVLVAQTASMTTVLTTAVPSQPAGTGAFVEGTLTSSYMLSPGSNYFLGYLQNLTGTAPSVATNLCGLTGGIPLVNGHYTSLQSNVTYTTLPSPLPSPLIGVSAMAVNNGTYCFYAR